MFTQDDVDSDSNTEPQRMSIGAARQLLGKMDSIHDYLPMDRGVKSMRENKLKQNERDSQ